jgi:hypothetical protein
MSDPSPTFSPFILSSRRKKACMLKHRWFRDRFPPIGELVVCRGTTHRRITQFERHDRRWQGGKSFESPERRQHRTFS